MNNWRHWDELIFKAPLHGFFAVKCVLHGIKPYHLVKSNYGLPQGGVGDASKYEVNKRFNKKYMLPYAIIPGKKNIKEKLTIIRKFMKEKKLSYPIVLKPDIGWAGAGIAIVKNEKEAETFLKNTTTHYLIQEYCNYKHEYGVFYYKLRGRPRIYSMNEKKVPTVIGDGRKTVKALIRDKRLLYLVGKRKLKTIPKKGEEVALTRIYNTGQGGIYKDVSAMATKTLLDAVEEAVGGTGFFYGRLDVKTKSEKALKEGKFKIIEVNGTDASSSNYFDPKYSWIDAYRIMNKQYNIMLKIALEHRHKPMKLLPYRKFMKRIRKSRKILKERQQASLKYH